MGTLQVSAILAAIAASPAGQAVGRFAIDHLTPSNYDWSIFNGSTAFSGIPVPEYLGSVGNLYDVGTYNQLRYTAVDGTIVHHVPSRLRGGELIADYATDRMAGTEFSIRLPASEADAVDLAATLRDQIPASARQELAWQIRDLRNYTNAPNSSLQQLIELNAFRRKWDFNVRGI